MKKIIERTFCHSQMKLLWAGLIIMGLTYLFAFGAAKESLPFILGQVLFGVIGLLREYRLYLIKPSLTPSIWRQM